MSSYSVIACYIILHGSCIFVCDWSILLDNLALTKKAFQKHTPLDKWKFSLVRLPYPLWMKCFRVAQNRCPLHSVAHTKVHNGLEIFSEEHGQFWYCKSKYNVNILLLTRTVYRMEQSRGHPCASSFIPPFCCSLWTFWSRISLTDLAITTGTLFNLSFFAQDVKILRPNSAARCFVFNKTKFLMRP